MKERPILFSAPMVRAILEGRKTQTRRVVKPQPVDDQSSMRPWVDDGPTPSGAGRCGHSLRDDECPYGVPGDRLWVREAWAWSGMDKRITPSDPWYRATHYKGEDIGIRWRPSIHMPRWASRITLEVVSVRVERLQEISEADARAEGVDSPAPLHAFLSLWVSINGCESWDANPWVWVVEFKRLEQP